MSAGPEGPREGPARPDPLATFDALAARLLALAAEAAPQKLSALEGLLYDTRRLLAKRQEEDA